MQEIKNELLETQIMEQLHYTIKDGNSLLMMKVRVGKDFLYSIQVSGYQQQFVKEHVYENATATKKATKDFIQLVESEMVNKDAELEEKIYTGETKKLILPH